MTVLDYVSQNGIQKFHCKTTTELVLINTHRSRTGNKTQIIQVFGRENFCCLKDWDKYKSFDSFANKEIAKIKKGFANIPIFYVNFSDFDWQKEIKNTFIEDERDFDYYIDFERTRAR